MSLDELKKSVKITDEMHQRLVAETEKKLKETGYVVREYIPLSHKAIRGVDIYASRDEEEEVFVEVHCGRLANQLRKYKKAIEKLKEPHYFEEIKAMKYQRPKQKIIIVFPIDDAKDIEVWGFKELSSK